MMLNNNLNITKTLTFYLSSGKIKSSELPRKLKRRLFTTWKSQKFRVSIWNFAFLYLIHILSPSFIPIVKLLLNALVAIQDYRGYMVLKYIILTYFVNSTINWNFLMIFQNILYTLTVIKISEALVRVSHKLLEKSITCEVAKLRVNEEGTLFCLE